MLTPTGIISVAVWTTQCPVIRWDIFQVKLKVSGENCINCVTFKLWFLMWDALLADLHLQGSLIKSRSGYTPAVKTLPIFWDKSKCAAGNTVVYAKKYFCVSVCAAPPEEKSFLIVSVCMGACVLVRLASLPGRAPDWAADTHTHEISKRTFDVGGLYLAESSGRTSLGWQFLKGSTHNASRFSVLCMWVMIL